MPITALTSYNAQEKIQNHFMGSGSKIKLESRELLESVKNSTHLARTSEVNESSRPEPHNFLLKDNDPNEMFTRLDKLVKLSTLGQKKLQSVVP